MLNPELIFIPCILLIFLTITVLGIMFQRRIKGIKAGEVDPSYFKTYNTGQVESMKAVQAQRNFSNLQEAPPIFISLCLIAYVTGHVDSLILCLAWAFFVLRTFHTIVHVTSNKLRPRMLSFAGGWLVIIIMSATLVYKII